MSKPIAIRVTRHQCPDCGKSYASRSGCVAHINRCWYNPDAHGCKTCVHFAAADSGDWQIGDPGSPEDCAVGVSLEGRPACSGCGGYGWADTNTGAQKPCGSDVSVNHVGDGREVKAGPIVHCPLWEPDEFHQPADSPALPASS